jgi:hypothetical protein
MKNTRRAVRRHHRQRMIARIMRSLVFSGVPEKDRLQRALRWYNNRQKCSCWMCGHRRKWCGPTMQERREKGAAQADPL